jgi:DNA-binding SARP family transcriptional activator/tetratricopeptide (TPR) repeat protein
VSDSGLRLSVLGPPVVLADGVPLTVDTRKATALLAYLAVERGVHNRDSLAELLWPDYATDRARAALRRTLSTLRSALGGRWVSVARDSVSLEGGELDLDEFRRLAAGGKLADLEAAAALYRGPFLAGFGLRDSTVFDDWQSFRSASLARELGGVLDRLADGCVAAGDAVRAVEHARRRLALDPLNETAHRRLIVLYGTSGERAAALAQYRDCVRVLHRELGVSPTEETTAAYHAVREGGTTAVAPAQPGRVTDARPHPLVGRDRELAALLDAYARVADEGRLAVLDGETGIGKTRLADELVARVRAGGGVAATARGVEGESGLAFGCAIELVRSALREGDAAAVGAAAAAETARLVPELGTPPTPALDGPGAQARFLDGVARVLAEATSGDSPGLLVVDDAHWADASSLEVLAFLVRRLRDRPVLVLMTWRTEETPPDHPARRILADATHDGLAGVVVLERLDRDDVAELAAAAGASPELSERLYEETQGLPFFVVEYLDSQTEDSSDGGALPPGVRGLLEARVRGVSEVARQVVAATAVLGRPSDPGLIRAVSGRSEEETVTALEELARRGVLAENNAGELAFRHEQARQVAYELTSTGRRRLLHGRAADALDPRSPGAIALHLRLAGRDEEAAAAYRRAGEQARDLYANSEALAAFREALALGDGNPASLHEAIGDLETLAGEYGRALGSYETAAALAGPERLGAVEHRIGLLHERRGEWELAERSFADALRTDPVPELTARIVADRSLNAHRRRRDDEARTYAQDALTLAEQAKDARALAQAHNILGVLAAARGDHAEARTQLEQSLATADDDPVARAAALNNLALALRAEGELDRALALTEEALALCVAVGDRHREAALENNTADLLQALGRRDEAMERLKSAVATFAEIGEDAATEPEIWKLVEW